MKTLGMIGGTSWHSTIEYYRLINQGVGERIGHHLNPPLILHSINIAVMRAQNWEIINKTYVETAQKLENAGAEAIVICANTPHKVYDYVQPKIGIPILHIAESIGQKAKEQSLKSLGLLGTRPVVTEDFIPAYLKDNFEIQTLISDAEFITPSHDYIANELTQGTFSDEAREFYTDQIQRFQEKGAEGIILGCTELPILLAGEDAPLPLIETTQLHAQSAVDFILSE